MRGRGRVGGKPSTPSADHPATISGPPVAIRGDRRLRDLRIRLVDLVQPRPGCPRQFARIHGADVHSVARDVGWIDRGPEPGADDHRPLGYPPWAVHVAWPHGAGLV